MSNVELFLITFDQLTYLRKLHLVSYRLSILYLMPMVEIRFAAEHHPRFVHHPASKVMLIQ